MKKILSMNDLAAIVKGRRLELGLSQNALSQKAQVSREWIVQFEGGKISAQTIQLLRVIEALDLSLSVSVNTNAVAKDSTSSTSTSLDELLQRYGAR